MFSILQQNRVEINLSREMKLQHYQYSLQLKEKEGRGRERAKSSAKLFEDIKNKIRQRASGRIKGDDCAALTGSRKIGGVGAKEIREEHA